MLSATGSNTSVREDSVAVLDTVVPSDSSHSMELGLRSEEQVMVPVSPTMNTAWLEVTASPVRFN